MDKFEQVQTSLDQFEQVHTNSCKFVQVHTTSGKLEKAHKVWKSSYNFKKFILDKLGQVQTSLIQFEHV